MFSLGDKGKPGKNNKGSDVHYTFHLTFLCPGSDRFHLRRALPEQPSVDKNLTVQQSLFPSRKRGSGQTG